VGAERMAGICRRVEELGKEGRVADASGFLREIAQEHRRIRRSFTRYLEDAEVEDTGGGK